jgi:hypothetical protein
VTLGSSVRFALLFAFALAGCEPADCDPGNWAACDIRDVGCQQRVLRAVQCDRGHELAALPPVRVISTDAYRAELVERAATATPRPNWDATFTMLGILPMSVTGGMASIDVSVANVAAYYSPATSSITIIDRGVPMTNEHETRTLAHELVHAIQDHRYDLTAFTSAADTLDELDARRSVLEGDAELFGILYAVRQRGDDPRHLLWLEFFTTWLSDLLMRLHDSAAPFAEARGAFPYFLGSRGISQTWEDEQSAAFVDELFAHPPTSVVEMVGAPIGGGSAPEAITCPPPDPPAGYHVVDDDALGPLALIAFLSTDDDVWLAAEQVRGDVIRVVTDDVHTAFAWRIRTDALMSSTGPIGRHPATNAWATEPGHVVVFDGRDVVLVGSDDPDVAASWTAATAHCPQPP